ncbi:hypothetical protein ASG43_09160 [Aureimonas sp. Leaf454]|nr:hypothetical protein ASG43_09160 [Aureimonas sp. Leaf454]
MCIYSLQDFLNDTTQVIRMPRIVNKEARVMMKWLQAIGKHSDTSCRKRIKGTRLRRYYPFGSS